MILIVFSLHSQSVRMQAKLQSIKLVIKNQHGDRNTEGHMSYYYLPPLEK